jgi:hypothetical protein
MKARLVNPLVESYKGVEVEVKERITPEQLKGLGIRKEIAKEVVFYYIENHGLRSWHMESNLAFENSDG